MQRPTTRAECDRGGTNEERQCPFVSCKYHLFWEYVKHHPDAEVWDLKASCVLDVADEGGSTLENVGEVMGLTRERVRQLEADLLRKLRKKPILAQFRAE